MDEHNNNAKKIFFFFQLLASSYGDAHAVWNVRTKRERLKKNTTRKGGESGLFGLYSGRLKAALVQVHALVAWGGMIDPRVWSYKYQR